MNYKAFYRTYRPSSFDQVVGQDHIVKTLVNLIKLNKISHGYLFSGPRGTGKTSIAKIFANAINCIHSESPEKICTRCLENQNKTLDIIEMDAASNNSVNDIRTIRDQIEFAPTNSPYKIYIIDEVHMLSKGAFNALLMTLEEPPAHAIFILATTDPDKIPDTILSRVQRYNFKRITKSVLEDQLRFVFKKENISYDEESLEMIASLANGSLRDALSIADQINAYSNSNIKIENLIDVFGLANIDSQVHFLNLIAKKSTSEALQYFELLIKEGVDISKLISSLIELLKDTLIYDKTKNPSLVNYQPSLLESLIIKKESIYKILDILIPLSNEIKFTDIPNQLMQLAIIKICSFEESLIDVGKKDTTIESLKKHTSKTIELQDKQTKANEVIKEVEETKTTKIDINQTTTNAIENSTTRDITDEYFATQNLTQPNSIVDIEDNNINSQINNEEINKYDYSSFTNKTQTKTILGDFSEADIKNKFNNLIDDFSLDSELDKFKNEKTENTKVNINNTNNLNLDTKPVEFKNSFKDEIIDNTTELLNLSNESDGNEKEVDETLLTGYDTSKQIFDTNEINVNEEIIEKVSLESKEKTSEENLSFSNNETDIKTKEFIIEEKHEKQPTPIKINNELTQPKIINLFLLSKKDTFDIFKEKLELSSCVDKEEYDSFGILLKEVRFVCSSNDFILVSSSEDWVIEDLNKNINEPLFRTFISEYFGNNIHFFAITKKDYMISKELYSELKKSGNIPEAKPLDYIENVLHENKSEKEIVLNEIESKGKNIFSGIFSRKKE